MTPQPLEKPMKKLMREFRRPSNIAWGFGIFVVYSVITYFI